MTQQEHSLHCLLHKHHYRNAVDDEQDEKKITSPRFGNQASPKKRYPMSFRCAADKDSEFLALSDGIGLYARFD
jgi:hypothetical protein